MGLTRLHKIAAATRSLVSPSLRDTLTPTPARGKTVEILSHSASSCRTRQIRTKASVTVRAPPMISGYAAT